MLEAWQRTPTWRLNLAELDRAAEVTTFDLMQARILWQQSAPRLYLDLLEAAPAEDE